MNRTYEQILDSMKGEYFKQCNTAVEEGSQIMRCFEILASELFSLSCYGDYIFRQAFVQSASGNNLDKAGELRGCIRKTPSKAIGTLSFSVSQPGETDIIIAKDTVCSVSGKPYLQYATVSDCIIKAGTLETAVDAVSLGAGDEYNAKPNTITVMVNAPAGVTAVTNKEKFDGGYTAESDAAYRDRILRHYNIDPNSINAVSNENRILTLDFVVDCSVVPRSDSRGMSVYVATKSNTLSADEKTDIAYTLPVLDSTGIEYEIQLAKRLQFDLLVNAHIMMGFDEQKIKAEIKNKLFGVISATRINESIPLSRLTKAVSDIDGLLDVSFYTDLIKGDSIMPNEFGVLSAADIEVSCIYD